MLSPRPDVTPTVLGIQLTCGVAVAGVGVHLALADPGVEWLAMAQFVAGALLMVSPAAEVRRRCRAHKAVDNTDE